MTIKEQIIKKIERIPEQNLDEFYELVKEFEEDLETNALAKIRNIRISAAQDFSVNATLYPYPLDKNDK